MMIKALQREGDDNWISINLGYDLEIILEDIRKARKMEARNKAKVHSN
jgi:hypothetical protein